VLITSCPEEGGYVHVMDVATNQVHNFRPFRGKSIIFPMTWMYRCRISTVEKGEFRATLVHVINT